MIFELNQEDNTNVVFNSKDLETSKEITKKIESISERLETLYEKYSSENDETILEKIKELETEEHEFMQRKLELCKMDFNVEEIRTITLQ